MDGWAVSAGPWSQVATPTSAQRHQPGRTRQCRAEGYAGATQPASTFLVVTALAGPGMLIEVNVIASMPERPLAIKCRGLTETARFPVSPICYSASHSVHPVGVSQHVHAHQPKYDEHNHGGHDPHYTHVGFFSALLIPVWHSLSPARVLDRCGHSESHRRNIAGKSIRFRLRQPYGTGRSRKFPFGNPDGMMAADPHAPGCARRAVRHHDQGSDGSDRSG